MTQTTHLRKSSKWVIYEESLDQRSALTSSGWRFCKHRTVIRSAGTHLLLPPPRQDNSTDAQTTIFIRPFEKRTYYAMAMSVRLSVRPSVRPSFPDFFSTRFEISIWNLVYAFSRWHDMSSLSFITIGSLWPSLQPKVGQTQFLQSWPYKSR